MKPPENIDEIREQCADYFARSVPRGADDFTKMVLIPLRRRAFAAESPRHVQTLLQYIDKLERKARKC